MPRFFPRHVTWLVSGGIVLFVILMTAGFMLWQGSAELERRVLKVVAHRSVALTGREATQRFGLGKSGSTQVAVERLIGDGHLVADPSTRTRQRVIDPFFAAWLRGEG